MQFRLQRKFLSIPYVLFLIVFVVLPLLIIVYYSFTDASGQFSLGNVTTFFTDPKKINVLATSFVFAIGNTVLTLLIGYPLAMILANKKMVKNPLIVLLFVMPMWINFVIRTWATKDLLFWLGVTQPNPLPNFELAVMIGLVYNFLPFVILPLYTTMLKMDKSQIEAAQDLGATPVQTFFKVIIPMTMPGIISASLMVFMPTLSSQVIPNILGGGKVVLFGVEIYNTFLGAGGDNKFNYGSFMSLIMLVFVGTSIILTQRYAVKEDTGRKSLW